MGKQVYTRCWRQKVYFETQTLDKQLNVNKPIYSELRHSPFLDPIATYHGAESVMLFVFVKSAPY